MSHGLREELRGWAAERRLSFVATPEPLPAATPRLRRGGTRERASLNVCAGILPGGVGGRLGHHQHGDGAGGPPTVDTVVLATLPSGSRAACALSASAEPAAGDLPGAAVHEVDGVRWVARPAEPAAALRAIAGPRVRRALAAAPPGTQVELEHGELCVVAPGRALAGEAELDALCHLAAELALALAALVRGRRLDPESPLAPPPAAPSGDGIEAFAERYASAAGLRREDPEELRRHLPALLPGRALAAWHGELGAGVRGHLAVWGERGAAVGSPGRWLLAARAVPAGWEGAGDSGHRRLLVEDGIGVLGEPLGAAEPAAERLDALREAVVTLAPSPPSRTLRPSSWDGAPSSPH